MNRVKNKDIFRILVLGAPGVGKTTLIEKLSDKPFLEGKAIEFGVNIFLKQVNVDGHDYKLQFWDFVDELIFDDDFLNKFSDKEADFLNKFSDKEADYFKKFYYKGVSAIFFVFDLSQPETFESYQKLIKKAWNEGLLKKCPVLIIGNKLDLVINPKTIDRQKYREFVKKEGLLGYIELNSKGNIHPLIKEIPQIIQTNLKKNYQVKFLVNSKEFEEIRRSAKISHQTRSEFIRAAIRDKIRVLNSQEQDLDRPQEIHEDKLRLEELKYIREVLERMEKKENKLKEMR